MVTTSLEYSHTIGIASFEGRGFMNPIDIKFKNDLLYILSRSNASNKNNRVSAVSIQSDHKFEFANWGEENGQSILPTSITFDLDNKFYLSDEHLNRISIFDLEGNFIEKWGEYGTEKGKLNRPSGISINSDNELLVVDHLNSRIQKFDTKGNFINSFGEFGNLEGQFNYPWGLSIDAEDNIYVADWRNNRIQIFNKDGEFIKIINSFHYSLSLRSFYYLVVVLKMSALI
jgi:DNA-binding beta-propeller fold protein YncE